MGYYCSREVRTDRVFGPHRCAVKPLVRQPGLRVRGVRTFRIVYLLGAWLAILAAPSWYVDHRKPISESNIKTQIERRSGPSR